MKSRCILIGLLSLLSCLNQAYSKHFLVFEFTSMTGSKLGRGQTVKYNVSSKTSETLFWIIEIDHIADRGTDGFHEVAYFTGDPGTERNLYINHTSKTVYYKLNGGHAPNMYHRLIYGRSDAGKGQYKFSVLYQQVDGMNDDGTHDNAVGYSITPCVTWPNQGQSIGVTGPYPKTISLKMCRLDGGADENDRWLKEWTLQGNLRAELTRLLNLQNVANLANAQDWVVSYYTGLGYTHAADQSD